MDGPDEIPKSLIARMAAGDRRAFDELYDELAARVFGIILRVLRDPGQSEEVTQEVFIEIWEHAGRFDGDRASARTWAISIAHRRAVDRVRSEQATRDRAERLGRQPTDAPVPTPADTVLQEFEQRRTADALATLSDTQRAVIELAYYEGLTHTEIANRLGIPLGTVKSRAREGLAALRRRLSSDR